MHLDDLEGGCDAFKIKQGGGKRGRGEGNGLPVCISCWEAQINRECTEDGWSIPELDFVDLLIRFRRMRWCQTTRTGFTRSS